MITADTELAARALFAGKIVVFPTETVYGIGANVENHDSVKRIYKIKKRPKNRPFIIHIYDKNLIGFWSDSIPEYARLLIDKFWPGPLTLILNRNIKLPNHILPGQMKLAIRNPNHPQALKLLEKFSALGGLGVVAPSANLFGRISSTTIEEAIFSVGSKLRNQDIFLIGNKCTVGIESTIIDCTNVAPTILRPGYITKSEIEKVIKKTIDEPELKIRSTIKFPGNSNSHYSPKAQVRVDSDFIIGSGYIALARYKTPNGLVRLISPSDTREFSKNLYSAFFKADEQKLNHIFVKLPLNRGIGTALVDRILKAASKTHV